jgi:hypothetical protein
MMKTNSVWEYFNSLSDEILTTLIIVDRDGLNQMCILLTIESELLSQNITRLN